MKITDRELIAEVDENIMMLPEYFDSAIIGLMMEEVVVYNEDKVIEILMEHDEMEWEDAVEHYSFNIRGSLGEGFPVYARVMKEE